MANTASQDTPGISSAASAATLRMAKRTAIRAIVAEALKLADDECPVVRYDLAHAHTVLGYSSDREAVTR